MPYPVALALTLLTEVPVYIAALTLLAGVRPARAAAAALLVNCLTHPLAWWFLTHTPAARYWPAFAVTEAAVCLTEALVLRAALRLRGALPYGASLTANAASVLAGILLSR